MPSKVYMAFHRYESQGGSGTSCDVEATVLYPLPKSNNIRRNLHSRWLLNWEYNYLFLHAHSYAPTLMTLDSATSGILPSS